MMKRLGVAPEAIAAHAGMRRELLAAYPNARLNHGNRLTEDGLISFLADCDAAIIGFEPVTERVLGSLPLLEVISKYGNGCEKIDFHALQRRRIRFGYVWGMNKLAVAELTVCMMVAGLRWIMPLNVAMRAGERPRMRDGRLLSGRVVGIHGCGSIGKDVVRLLKPFGCTILACDIRDYPEFYREHGVAPVSFETLLERSELLSLHLPMTSATRKLYTREILAQLRDDCVLINTCRGGIVDEEALLERLESGKLRAACFDVFAVEPAANDRLLRHPNMLATPHIGASAEEMRIAMVRAAIHGLSHNEVVEPARFYA